MADREAVLLRRPFFSQGRTAPLRLHSLADIPPDRRQLTPIKLKTETSKYIKSSSNHLPVSEQLKMNVEETLAKGKQLFSQSNFDETIPTLKPLLNTSKEVECLYYIGCSFFYKSRYQHSIYYLNLVVEKEPTFNRSAFIVLAAAYKELHLPKVSVKILLKGLEYFPNYQQAMVYLAKHYIKIRQYEMAVELLQKRLGRNCSGVIRLTYADCLRLLGRLEESLDHYNVLCKDNTFGLVGLMKRMTCYYELKQYEASLRDCDSLISHQVRSSEVHYFRAMNILNLNKQSPQQFPVDFSRSLDLNNHPLAVTRSLCEIVKEHISRKDIYSAELQMKRIDHLSIKLQEIKDLKLFVEGAIDCVKKRYSEAISKLTQVEKNLKSRALNYSAILSDNIDIYLAYSYFLSSEYSKAIKYYSSQKHPQVSSDYNKLICEGILHSQNNDFSKCYAKINEAKSLLPHYEPYFYLGINYVQQHFALQSPLFLEKAITELQAGTEFNPTSLYYFYLSLVLIKAGRPADSMISVAIEKSDDNVADYYFVRGIVEAQRDLSVALNDFSSAIEILKIPAYYKQRSKCLYQLGMYSLAIQDLLKVLSMQSDYQASILLAFNYYSNQQYLLSLNTLHDLLMQQQNQYLLGLKVALNIHLKNYSKAGTLGDIIHSMELGVKITDQKKLDKFERILEEKITIGEFDIVELLCLGGTYHFVHGDYEKSQICFFDALNELKAQLTKNSTAIDFGTEAKIYQSKFNIALTHLMLKEHQECKKLLDILIEETESEQSVTQLLKLHKFITEELDHQAKMSIHADQITIDIFPNYKLLSQNFPVAKTRIKGAVLVVKPIMFYPQKIKFNIFPELNPKFLREFGVWKIENTPEPPWVMRDGGSFKFTEDLDLEGGVVEYTDSGEEGEEEESEVEAPERRENERDESTIPIGELKLSEEVNSKLEKMIKDQSQPSVPE